MKKYVPLSLIFFALVAGFQNCSPNGLNQTDMAGNSVSGEVSQAPGASQSSPLPAIEAIEVVTPSSLVPNGSTMQRVAEKTLYLDLQSGSISEVNSDGQPVDPPTPASPRRCLTQNDLSILMSILESAQLCQAAPASASPKEVCAMIYKSPYARLHSLEGHSIDLGEAHSSCDRGPDLCGSNPALLKAFVANLAAHLQEKKCQP